jgi:UDP-N-acetylglucosamine 1-carboxyvinyltransferase
MVALLSTCDGVGLVTENVFDNRFQYVNELKRLGASIVVEDRVAIIKGVNELSGAEVMATDLRAGAALVITGLIAKGKVTIGNVKYIDRGYEYIEDKLMALGADIKRIKG